MMNKARDDRAVFEYSQDGVLISVPDGQILAANPAAQALSGAILFHATMSIAEIHDNVTCRTRSTSDLGRNRISSRRITSG